MYAKIDGVKIPEERFNEAMKLVREVDPELAMLLDGYLQWHDDEDSEGE